MCTSRIALATLRFSLAIIIISAALSNAEIPVANLRIQPTQKYGWWIYSSPVSFKESSGHLPETFESLQGRIFDVSGSGIEAVTVTKQELLANGWNWTPKSPGYYEIEFVWKDIQGINHPVEEAFALMAPNKKTMSFNRKRYGVAVVPKLKDADKIIGQFGFQYHLNKQEEISLAKLIGYDFTMIHSIPWGANFTNLADAIEPEQDFYKWTKLDDDVAALEKAGFVIGAQFCYTPTWASPHPELVDKINICVRESSAYAPKNIEDFTSFVSESVQRYKDRIAIWEIWNEPNLPGSSCFWSDTPEKYIEMLKAGYETIKKIQPESDVLNGGLGMRISYLAFYDRILEGGAAPFYDKLSLHAISTDLEPFRAVERSYNAPSKPAMVTEWHAILLGNMSGGEALPSESALSLRMMRDLLNQLKQGVIRTAIFEMTNQIEKESLGFAIQNKWFTHSAGLFRLRPRIEPRHAAVVMAVFLETVGKKATFLKEIQLGKDAIGIALNTNAGDVLAIITSKAGLPKSEMAALAGPNSVLSDWEGKELSISDKTDLDAEKVFYLSNPKSAALNKAALADALIPETRMHRASKDAPTGAYVTGDILADNAKFGSQELTDGWKWVSLRGDSTAIKAKALIGISESGLDAIITVDDPVHFQTEDKDLWFGDSVQLAIDCEGKGRFGSSTEVVAGLKGDTTIFRKITNADAGADLPTKRTLINSAIEFGSCQIERAGDSTIYRLHLDWSELYPMVYDPAKPLKVALLINNNAGQGRAGYLEWGSGLGAGEKDPAAFGTLKAASK